MCPVCEKGGGGSHMLKWKQVCVTVWTLMCLNDWLLIRVFSLLYVFKAKFSFYSDH